MKRGYLSTYFSGVAIKRLSEVEANPEKSNQHEFNGVNQLKEILGSQKQTKSATYIYLNDSEPTISDSGFVTWYDARENHPKRSEYRLYYPPNVVMAQATANDLFVIGILPDGAVLIIIVQANSTIENQILWLFDASDIQKGFLVQDINKGNDQELNFAARTILTQLGIEIVETDENYLATMLERFGDKLPSTKIFSEFARNTQPDINALDSPDIALISWMDQEELLFRTFERHHVGKRIKLGFEDVDSFIRYSLSVQNRRKSRVGHAFENHLEKVFKDHGVAYSRGKRTENKAKPDFIFPNIESYHLTTFPENHLTMLGAKSTCKDRWRQILSEADRIKQKHLVTLEPGISLSQTTEMQKHHVQLVIPNLLHETYQSIQVSWLLDIASFLTLVKEKQTKSQNL